jgi:hypothetical protein
VAKARRPKTRCPLSGFNVEYDFRSGESEATKSDERSSTSRGEDSMAFVFPCHATPDLNSSMSAGSGLHNVVIVDPTVDVDNGDGGSPSWLGVVDVDSPADVFSPSENRRLTFLFPVPLPTAVDTGLSCC